MKKKYIAFVVNGLYGGGAEKVLQVFLANFDRRKYDITLINLWEENILHEFYPEDVKYKSILKKVKEEESKFKRFRAKVYNKIKLLVYDNFSPRTFRLLYLRDKFDVEIAFIEGYATRIVSGGRSDKKIAWVHIDLKLYPWTDISYRSKEEQIKCYSTFDKVISVSKSVKESFEELFFRKSTVVYNPIDSEEIRKMSAQFTVERNNESLLLVSAGRLVLQKGYDRLIPVVGKLIAEGFNFILWIVGEGSERKHLEHLIQEWNLERNVKLWGYQSNPYPYIKAGDMFVCSSRSEGYSTAVTESLILGVPLITTLCAGMKELLDDSKYGIIVENEDNALLEGMRNILTNKRLVSHYTAQAEGGRNRFSLECRMNDIYNVIDN